MQILSKEKGGNMLLGHYMAEKLFWPELHKHFSITWRMIQILERHSKNEVIFYQNFHQGLSDLSVFFLDGNISLYGSTGPMGSSISSYEYSIKSIWKTLR